MVNKDTDYFNYIINNWADKNATRKLYDEDCDRWEDYRPWKHNDYKSKITHEIAKSYYKNKNLTKTKQTNEDKNMFDFNMGNMFNGMFGKVEKGKCAFAMGGGIAVKTSNGYKTYNVKKQRLTNVTNFCFDASDFFFVLPTAKVAVGDVILVGGKPKCVIEVLKKSIKVIDYENSEIREIVPERHVFMGATVFYGKITSMFGAGAGKGKGIMSKIMQLMMMKSLMGGNGGNDGGNLMQMMMMQQFLGGGAANTEDMFENMFDIQMDEDEDTAKTDADDNDDEDTEEN